MRERGLKVTGVVLLVALMPLCVRAASVSVFSSEPRVANQTRIYHSPLGFDIVLPDHWVIVRQTFLQSRFVEDDRKVYGIEGMLGTAWNDAVKMVHDGNTEVFLNRKTADTYFVDRINAITYEAKPLSGESGIELFCEGFKQNLSLMYKEATSIQQCKYKEIAGVEAVYLVFDDPYGRVTNIQYQIPGPRNSILIVTATCKKERFDSISNEFDEIIRTLKPTSSRNRPRP